MLQITKKTDYGLNFLLTLASQNPKQPLSLAKISEAKNLPKPFLAKLAADLVKAKIIKSKEGVAGGYMLAKRTAKISLKDVIWALEKNSQNDYQGCARCDCKFCTRRDVKKPLEDEIAKSLQKKSLADLIGSPPNLSTRTNLTCLVLRFSVGKGGI